MPTSLFTLSLLAIALAAAPMALAQDLTENSEKEVIQDGQSKHKASACLEATPGMVCIPGGTFIRGSDNDPHVNCAQSSYNKKGVVNTNPAAELWMDSYYMDVTEVTTAAFKACVKSGKCPKAGPKYADFSRDKQPITGVSWYDAYNYCKVQGKHLPSEAEWEKAARGAAGELYPWGNAPASCENAVIMDDKGRSCGVLKKKGSGADKGRVLEVCSRGASRYGLCDMIGNAEEWVADWYTDSYEACGEACLGVHPLGPCDGNNDKRCDKLRYKVVRGGSWYWPAEHATGIHRRSHVPNNDPYHHFGFRCAASQAEMKALAASAQKESKTKD